MQLAAESIIEVGRELIAQKKELGHGNFLPWIESEFKMSSNSAMRYMQVATEFGDKFSTVENLAPSVLYALAAPSTPEPVLERAAAGEKVTAPSVSRHQNKTRRLARAGYPDSR